MIHQKKITFFGSLIMAFLTVWVALEICNRVTDGFNIKQITSSLPEKYFYETCGDRELALQLLNQPFIYIGKGCQSYVFQSQDGKYVIKFFKHKHLRPLDWLSKLPFSSEWIADKVRNRTLRIQQLFSATQLSYEKFSEDSGVVFVHLNKKPFYGRHITLIDKLGFPHPIYLDDYQFHIQKRAIPICEVLLNTHDEFALRQQIDRICEAMISRMRKGVADRDKAVVNNIAILPEEDKILFIDVGGFYLHEMQSEEEIFMELADRLSNMSVWAHNHARHVSPYLKEKCEKMNLPIDKAI